MASRSNERVPNTQKQRFKPNLNLLLRLRRHRRQLLRSANGSPFRHQIYQTPKQRSNQDGQKGCLAKQCQTHLHPQN